MISSIQGRRSVYLMTQRIRRHPFLALFDGADPNASTAERRTTTVPTQALFFLNDPFVHANSRQLADRTLAAVADEPRQVVVVYRSVLGRDPDPAGMENYVRGVLTKHWSEADIARDLRNSDEYRNKN